MIIKYLKRIIKMKIKLIDWKGSDISNKHLENILNKTILSLEEADNEIIDIVEIVSRQTIMIKYKFKYKKEKD